MKEKVSRKTFRHRLQAMVDHLRGQLLEGIYAPGDYLPAESALAERFQLSNNSVRKGLETLVQEGWIVKVDKVGSKVIKSFGRERTIVTVGCTQSIARDLEFARLLDDFHRLNPSIQIKPVTGTIDGQFLNRTYVESMREHMEAGTIDLFFVNNLSLREFMECGYEKLLEPLERKEEMYSFLNEPFAVDGVQYVQPIVFSPVVLCYNRQHFREANLQEPDSGWRWDDLARTAARLTIPNKRHGFYFYQVSENRWPLFLIQSGEAFSRNGDRLRNIRGTKMMEGIRLCGELMRNRDLFPNYLSESSADASRLFLEGKVSMILVTYNGLNDLKHSDIEYDISPVPFMDDPITLLVSIGVMASKHSRQKEAARQFVDYVSSVEGQESIGRRTVGIPAMKRAAGDLLPGEMGLNRPQRYPLFREIIPTYRLHTDLNLPVRALEPLRHLLKMYWSGLIDEDALSERIEALPL